MSIFRNKYCEKFPLISGVIAGCRFRRIQPKCLKICYIVACSFVLQAVSLQVHGQSPDNIRQFIEGLDAGEPGEIAVEPLRSTRELVQFYRANQHQPVWQEAVSLPGSRLAHLLGAIEQSAAHGFQPVRYHLHLLQDQKTEPLVREILATDAFLTQAKHRQNGVVDPQSIDPDWSLARDSIDVVSLLQNAVASGEVEAALEQLWPIHPEYRALLQKRAQLLALPNVETVTVPPGPILKPGVSNERVVLLKSRLLGPGNHSPEFDHSLLESVQSFQLAAGLDGDGIVGPATLEVLNASHFSWIDRIDANLERWRWLPDRISDTYLRVNIASFTLRGIRNGAEDFSMPVVVGRPYRSTPVFVGNMKYLVYNPYWNVPTTIAVKDKLPLLRSNPGKLENQGYEVKPAGSADFISVSEVDWASITSRNFSYLLRQKPGDQNALGRVKFMLPNPYAVYLHDTPDHSLFSKQERGFSSGCIRLSDPLGLALWVLDNDGQSITADTVQQQVDSRQTNAVYLRKPLPVLIVYLTAFVDDSGTVVFRRDLYQRDQAIIDALKMEST